MKSHPLSVALSVFCALLLLVGGGFGVAAVLAPGVLRTAPLSLAVAGGAVALHLAVVAAGAFLRPPARWKPLAVSVVAVLCALVLAPAESPNCSGSGCGQLHAMARSAATVLLVAVPVVSLLAAIAEVWERVRQARS